MNAIAAEPITVRLLELVAETDAHEGPVYAADEDALWFTSVRRGALVALKRLELATGRIEVVREDANVANGMVLDREGGLVICEQGTFETPARISRLDRMTSHARVAVGTPGHPDGLKVDDAGRIYGSATTGVEVWDPSGRRVGEIELPGTVNFTFGRPGRDVLFITTDTAVWAAALNTKGA